MEASNPQPSLHPYPWDEMDRGRETEEGKKSSLPQAILHLLQEDSSLIRNEALKNTI